MPLDSKNDQFIFNFFLIIFINLNLFRNSFNDLLHKMVDQTPVFFNETVSIFYVKEGQRTSTEILQNSVI